MNDNEQCRFPLYLNGKQGVLFVPPSLTRDDLALLRQQIENALFVIAEAFVREESSNTTSA
jgi:hypothetical protein